jgi:hypothetical protein
MVFFDIGMKYIADYVINEDDAKAIWKMEKTITTDQIEEFSFYNPIYLIVPILNIILSGRAQKFPTSCQYCDVYEKTVHKDKMNFINAFYSGVSLPVY